MSEPKCGYCEHRNVCGVREKGVAWAKVFYKACSRKEGNSVGALIEQVALDCKHYAEGAHTGDLGLPEDAQDEPTEVVMPKGRKAKATV
jgi:hypothetical protein